MGALYLDVLDRRMADAGLCYARFMDDWVVLSPTRWALRRAVSLVNRTLEELKVEQHPGKTFVGKVERGFDFLGYRISAEGIIGVAAPSVHAFQERVLRLYEQNAPPEVIRRRIGDYVRRWKLWVVSGIPDSAGMLRWLAEQALNAGYVLVVPSPTGPSPQL